MFFFSLRRVERLKKNKYYLNNANILGQLCVQPLKLTHLVLEEKKVRIMKKEKNIAFAPPTLCYNANLPNW